MSRRNPGTQPFFGSAGGRVRLTGRAVWTAALCAFGVLAAWPAAPSDHRPGFAAAHAQTPASAPADAARRTLDLSELPGAPPAVEPPAVKEPTDVQRADLASARRAIEDGQATRSVRAALDALRASGVSTFELYLLIARACQAQDDVEPGIRAAERAVAFRPTDADANALMATLLVRANRAADAIPHLRAACAARSSEPNSVTVTWAWFQLGALLETEGYLRAAEQAYAGFDRCIFETHTEHRNAEQIAALLERQPLGTLTSRLTLLEELGDQPGIDRLTDWAVQQWPDDVQAARLRAQALLDAGRPADALEFCRRRMQSPDAANGLVETAIAAAKGADTVAAWVAEIPLDPARPETLRFARLALRRLVESDLLSAAEQLGQRLLVAKSDALDAAWDLAGVQVRSGEVARAIATLAAAFKAHPELESVPIDRLRAWRRNVAARPDAADALKRVADETPADFARDFALALSWLDVNRTRTDELLASALAAEPGFMAARLTPIQMALEEHRWSDAASALEPLAQEFPKSAAVQTLLGRALDGLDRNEEAATAFRNAVRLDREAIEPRLALARHYRRLGNPGSAERYYVEVLTLDRAHDEAFEGLMDSYLRNGKFDLARGELERAAAGGVSADAIRRQRTAIRFIERGGQFGQPHVAELRSQVQQYPDDAGTARALAVALIASRTPADAVAILEPLVAADTNDEDARVLLAVAHQQQADFAAAADTLQPLLERYPNRLSVLNDVAKYALYDFRLDDALAIYERLRKADPENDTSYRGEVLQELMRFRRAPQALEYLDAWRTEADTETRPRIDQIRLRIQIEAGKADEAVALATAALDAAPDDPEARLNFIEIAQTAENYEALATRVRPWMADERENLLGLASTVCNALVKLKRVDEALDVARSVTSRGTWEDSIQARILMGQIHAEAGNADLAVREFGALLEQQSLDEEQRNTVRLQFAQVLSSIGLYDRALAELQQLMQGGLPPRASEGLREMERSVLYQAGRMDEYLAITEDLFDANPNLPGLLNDLGYSWVDQSLHLDRATDMIRRAVAADPLNAAYLDSLGWACYKTGEFEQARHFIARAVQLQDGQDGVLFDHLGDTLWRLGQRDAAAGYWRESIDLLKKRIESRRTASDADVLATVEAKLATVNAGGAPQLAETLAETRARQAASAPAEEASN